PPPTANAPKLRAVLPLKVVLRMVPVAKVATPPPRPWATALPVAAVARLLTKALVKTFRVPSLATPPPTVPEEAEGVGPLTAWLPWNRQRVSDAVAPAALSSPPPRPSPAPVPVALF